MQKFNNLLTFLIPGLRGEHYAKNLKQKEENYCQRRSAVVIIQYTTGVRAVYALICVLDSTLSLHG